MARQASGGVLPREMLRAEEVMSVLLKMNSSPSSMTKSTPKGRSSDFMSWASSMRIATPLALSLAPTKRPRRFCGSRNGNGSVS